MACPDALVDRGKQDPLIQHFFSSLEDSLHLMPSNHPVMGFLEASNFVYDLVFGDHPWFAIKDFFSYNLPLWQNEPLTYSRKASYKAKWTLYRRDGERRLMTSMTNQRWCIWSPSCPRYIHAHLPRLRLLTAVSARGEGHLP